MADLNPELVLAVLSIEDRDTVERWLAVLGLPPESWPAVPPLATLLPLLAALILSVDMPEMSATDALRESAELLGVEDDADRDSSHHPGDRFARTLRRWIESADARRGQSDRARSHDAA